MIYYKIAFDYVDSFNKIVNKEQEYHIQILDNGEKIFDSHFYCCFPFYYIFPMYDCSLKIEDIKNILDLERDLLFLSIDMDKLINEFFRKKKDIQNNLIRIAPFVEKHNLCTDLRYSIMNFL